MDSRQRSACLRREQGPATPILKRCAANQLLELAGKVELIIKTDRRGNLLDGLIRKPQELLRLLHAKTNEIRNGRHPHRTREHVREIRRMEVHPACQVRERKGPGQVLPHEGNDRVEPAKPGELIILLLIWNMLEETRKQVGRNPFGLKAVSNTRTRKRLDQLPEQGGKIIAASWLVHIPRLQHGEKIETPIDERSDMDPVEVHAKRTGIMRERVGWNEVERPRFQRKRLPVVLHITTPAIDVVNPGKRAVDVAKVPAIPAQRPRTANNLYLDIWPVIHGFTTRLLAAALDGAHLYIIHVKL